MNKDADIPEWALRRATEEVNKVTGRKYHIESVLNWDFGKTLAAYITEHEEPSVDPDLIRAREICAEVLNNITYKSGAYDGHNAVRVTLKALKESKK